MKKGFGILGANKLTLGFQILFQFTAHPPMVCHSNCRLRGVCAGTTVSLRRNEQGMKRVFGRTAFEGKNLLPGSPQKPTFGETESAAVLRQMKADAVPMRHKAQTASADLLDNAKL